MVLVWLRQAPACSVSAPARSAPAFVAEEGVRRADVPLLEECKGHPSIRRLVREGREVLAC